MEEKNEEILSKQPKEKCIENFKKYILKPTSESSSKTLTFQNKEDLISFGIKGEFSSIYIRPIIYKIFLDLFPIEKSIQQWISITFTHRLLYSQLKSKYFNNTKKEKEEESEKIIKLDLSRTFPEIKEFNQNKIGNILFNVLYIYTKEFSVNYKQGMNEIISILFISLYPYYFPCLKTLTKIEIINAINSFNNNKKNNISGKINTNEIINFKFGHKKYNFYNNKNNDGTKILFDFFHDDKYLEVDLYFLFTNLMKNGFDKIYKEEILQKKCDEIIKNKLKIIDFELYQHCIDINLASEIFLEKWILSFFDRYTSIQNCISILDIIISQEYKNKRNDKFNLDMIDNICLAMIINYKKELLLKNDEEFLIFCLCYPKIQNLQEIIKLSNYIKLKLPNKDSIFNFDKRISVRINPKKPKYLLKSSRNMKNKINIKNNNKLGSSISFIEKRNIIKPNIKDIKNNKEIEEEKTLNNHKYSSNNLSVGNIFKSSIKLKNKENENKKDEDSFPKLNLGNIFNPNFEDVKTEDLIDIYYF